MDYSDSFSPEVGGDLFALSTGITIFWFVVFLVLIISYWKIFEKAGEPGWAAIIPIYNVIILLKIVGRPIWWIVLLLIPFLNIIFLIIVVLDLAKAFNKGSGFAIGLLLLGIVFSPILAFGDAQYIGTKTQI